MDENRNIGNEEKKKKRFSLPLPDLKPIKTNINSGQVRNFRVTMFSSLSAEEESSPLEGWLL